MLLALFAIALEWQILIFNYFNYDLRIKFQFISDLVRMGRN